MVNLAYISNYTRFNSRTNTINMYKVAIILLLIALFSPLSAENVATVRKIIMVNDQQLTTFFEPSNNILTITNSTTDHAVYFNFENILQQYMMHQVQNIL